MLLQHIVTLPNWEPVPNDPDEAIDYMAQWDYGEYCCNPEQVNAIYPRYGNAWRKDDYVLQRFFDGTSVLYRVMEEERGEAS